MKKNIIIIIVTLGILLIIAAGYFYENPVVINGITDGIMYSEAVSLLKTNVTGAIEYCKNTALDEYESGGSCFAEISCEAYKMGENKVRELCEKMTKEHFQDELQEKARLCIRKISIVCANDKNKAMKLCEEELHEYKDSCLGAVAMVVANRDLQGATEVCKMVKGIMKDGCYLNILYTAIKRKEINEALKVCEIYGEDLANFGHEVGMSEFFASRKCYCKRFIAIRISKTHPEKARKICETILEPEMKETCLNRVNQQ